MMTDFCAVLPYLPSWDEWIEITEEMLNFLPIKYLPSWDEWIEMDGLIHRLLRKNVSPFVG